MIDEQVMLRVARSVLEPADRVLEAGGNVGELALALAPLCARIWSVEADPERYPVLAENLRPVPTAAAVQGALMIDGGPGSVEFHLHEYRPGSSLLPIQGGLGAGEVQVPVVNAGRFIREHGITALVLDIERAEYEFLARLPELPPIRAVVVEWHPEGIAAEAIRSAEEGLAVVGLVRVSHDDSIPQFPTSAYVREGEQ